MGVWKYASNILGAWADRCSNRNENRTWADKEKKFRIFAGCGNQLQEEYFMVWSQCLFRGAASKKNLNI